MLRRYFRTIERLSANLAVIRRDPHGSIATLLASQELLFSRIAYIEHRIRDCRGKIATGRRVLATRQTKDEARRIKECIDALHRRIAEYESVMYVLRTFGDALICLYVTGFNLKPLQFQYKEASGFVSGKAGAREEWRTLRLLCREGIPAVLTDLTTAARYGDIIVSVNGIPQLIEVKTGKGGDVGRKARQDRDRRKINHYFTADSVRGDDSLLGNGEEMVRIPMHSAPRYHWTKVAKATTAAYERGYGIQTLERGARVLAIFDLSQLDAASLKARKGMKHPIVFIANSYKYDTAGRVPFTLSLLHPQDILLFYEGILQIVVFVDRTILDDHVASWGYRPCFEAAAGTLLIGRDPSSGVDLGHVGITIAQDFLERVPLEFLSLKWFLDEIAFKLEMTKLAGSELAMQS